MNRTLTNCHFAIRDFEQTRQKVLNYASRFSTFCFLDNHQYQLQPHSQECLLAAGIKRSITAHAGNALSELQQFLDKEKSWAFGHLAYDLKNEIEDLHSALPDHIGFPDLFFFEPEILITLSNDLVIDAADPEAVYNELMNSNPEDSLASFIPGTIKQRFQKPEYIRVLNNLREHILRGDCYEINFCQEFFLENAEINPLFIYDKLSKLSPNPFSALYRQEEHWLICASPERFMKKEGPQLISQPMKGTISRVKADPEQDRNNREVLVNSDKDRSENVMVVDLVRNDLSKVCKEGTVAVDELFGVYAFPQVYQMVSTVTGIQKEELNFSDIIRASFPMGSMTGAPKKRVMELIESYERTRRGIFSGAVGYITPNGDFDFNVVIRSLMYNERSRYLSFEAGSGITFYSEPEKEWEECLLKAAAIAEVLGKKD